MVHIPPYMALHLADRRHRHRVVAVLVPHSEAVVVVALEDSEVEAGDRSRHLCPLEKGGFCR